MVRELYAPEIAILPIGDLYTMGPREAAWAAGKLGARWVVPMHYRTFGALTGTVDMLRSELKSMGIAAESLIRLRGAQLIGPVNDQVDIPRMRSRAEMSSGKPRLKNTT